MFPSFSVSCARHALPLECRPSRARCEWVACLQILALQVVDLLLGLGELILERRSSLLKLLQLRHRAPHRARAPVPHDQVRELGDGIRHVAAAKLDQSGPNSAKQPTANGPRLTKSTSSTLVIRTNKYQVYIRARCRSSIRTIRARS